MMPNSLVILNSLHTSNGKFGRAIDFDHNGDYLKVSHFAGITTSNFVSASAWVKLDTLGSGGADDSAIIGSHANDDTCSFFGITRMVPEPTHLTHLMSDLPPQQQTV